MTEGNILGWLECKEEMIAETYSKGKERKRRKHDMLVESMMGRSIKNLKI